MWGIHSSIKGKLPSEEQTQRMKRLNSGRLLEKFGQSVKTPIRSQALIAQCKSHCRRGHTTGHHLCIVFIQTHGAAGEKIIWWGQSNIRPHFIVCLVHLWKVKLDFVNILEIKISQHKQHFAEIWNLFCGQLYRRIKWLLWGDISQITTIKVFSILLTFLGPCFIFFIKKHCLPGSQTLCFWSSHIPWLFNNLHRHWRRSGF